jgi:DNA gyrase subunit A
MGEWGNGGMGEWGNGEMGKWGNGGIQLIPQNPKTLQLSNR